jgi:2-polyprenyl-3-methyl-5-hydroxy-6-metoxy-1,4-benzoquinol methylase
VVECGRCRLLRLEPRPTLEELRAYYPKQYWFDPDYSIAGRLEEAYRRMVISDHVSFVKRAIKAAGGAGPALDVGCGGGLFLGMLRREGVEVAGLDLSPRAAAVAWSAQGVPALAGELANCPLRPATFAVVTMFHVLEHLLDPLAQLRTAHGLLRPGGRLVVQVPNAACWQFLLLGENWSGLDVPRHLVNFRPRDLENLLDAAGFEVVRRKFFSLRDNPAGLATSVWPWLDPMARRVRRVEESPRAKLAKDLLYMAVVAAALPFTALEAACRAGATIMVEARKKNA